MTEKEKKQIRFVAKSRDSAGKSISRTLRRADLIPGVLYGAGEETRLIAIDRRSAEKNLRHIAAHNIMADLVIEESGSQSNLKTIVKEIQTDPITGEILHMDFYHIGKNQPVKLNIPVKLTGESTGVKEGGILEQVLREVEVEGLPDAIPEDIEVDTTSLKINESIYIKDIKFPEGIRPLVDSEHVVVTILTPKTEEVPTPEEAAAVAPEEVQEPKVITQEIAEERRKEKEAKKEIEKGS
ncbi:MAG: 50S ribosomal protein L25 [Candidatus Omnitrophica bacterium]|nr:50S ribosomal protein L25 [Candidatus Omnitrophota bacterium]